MCDIDKIKVLALELKNCINTVEANKITDQINSLMKDCHCNNQEECSLIKSILQDATLNHPIIAGIHFESTELTPSL